MHVSLYMMYSYKTPSHQRMDSCLDIIIFTVVTKSATVHGHDVHCFSSAEVGLICSMQVLLFIFLYALYKYDNLLY